MNTVWIVQNSWGQILRVFRKQADADKFISDLPTHVSDGLRVTPWGVTQ